MSLRRITKRNNRSTQSTQTARCISLVIVCATLLLSSFAFAAPSASDDTVAVPANTTVFANDLAANDAVIATDTFSIVTPPSNGIATLTIDGLLDYTPNIGFASTDSLTYQVDDGAGGVDSATVTLNVVLNSDYLTSASSVIVGQEDIPTPLNLTVDPSVQFGGTLQDIISVEALYRAENQSNVPVSATIPIGATGIKITGYSTRNIDTPANNNFNDDYELVTANVDLRSGTYTGRLTYSVSTGTGNIDQFTFLDVPLGQSVLSDTSYVSGNWTGAADLKVEIVSGQIQISELQPLQIAYHVEFMTSEGNSADFLGASGDVQIPGISQSSFTIPAELEPTDGSSKGYIVLTGNSAADGASFAEEHKGFSRVIIDLESGSVSGVSATERGELDSLVTAWAFKNYPLIDLRVTPTAITESITTNTTATKVGDSAGPGVVDDPTIYINAAGELVVERATDYANAFTTMYTSENYRRTDLSSIATFVGVESDTTLFDASPVDAVDDDGKLVNIQSFDIPASSSIGIVEMSWQTIGGNDTNENVGFGFAVVDLNDNSSSGSITFSRTTTPDLVSWQGVPLGTTMFGAMDGTDPLYQSNKTAGSFTDGYAETARFTVVNNPDGSRTLNFTAESFAATASYADYIGTAQVAWLGSEPLRVEGVPASGILSHGSPVDGGGWEVDFADLPSLTFSTTEHGTGELTLDLVLSSTDEVDTITVFVEPVVDPPVFTADDVLGYAGGAIALAVSIGDSADIDGSETQIETVDISGVPDSIVLSATSGTVSNFGGGNWQVDTAALASLVASGSSTSASTITVSAVNTDTDDIDSDGIIEDVNNGAGVDELDTVIFQQTFTLTFAPVPMVNALISDIGNPTISGTAVVGADETLSVTVNSVTYVSGDGNLVVNGDGTWSLTIPAGNSIPDGVFSVTATQSHVGGASATDITSDELTIDTVVPAVPAVNALTTSDATPILTGTAFVAVGEALTVNVGGTTYTAGDGNLFDNGDGTWALSISMPLAEGTYEVIATVTDTAGNATIDTTSNELVVQATPLSTPTVQAQTTSDNTPVITGTAVVSSGETFTVDVNGVVYTAGDGQLVYNSDGTWALSIPTALADNSYDVIATVTDVFGNPYPDTSSNELVIDTTDPITPTIEAQTTNISTPIITGTATVASGETLSVTVDGATYTQGDGQLVVNGDGTWTLNVSTPLPEGTYSVSAIVADTAGNSVNDTTTDELIIDLSAPDVPSVVAQTTSDTTPTITGSATVQSGETLSVSVAGTTYTDGDGFLVNNGDGTWNLNVPTALPDGTFDVTASITDAAGNVSNDLSSSELTVDTTAPVTPSVQSQSTNNTSPVITGTASVAAGDVLTVEVNGTLYTAGDGHLVDNADGTWSLSVPETLAEGTYDITATVVDAAGNSATDTTTGELIIDITAPAAPGVTSIATTDTTPVIEGTVSLNLGESLTVEVDGVIYTEGDGNLIVNGDGTWTLTIPATNILSEALYQVIATVTDTAGNTAIDSGVDDLLVDLTAPSSPGVTSLTTNDTTPVLEGTALVSPGETLTVTVNTITYTAGDGNLVDNGDGTWTLAIPNPILEGLYDVTATLTDGAGNSSSDPSSNELLIDTTLPLTPTVTPLTTNNPTPVITGSANAGPGENLTVTVNGTVYSVGDGHLVDFGDGTWALTIPTALPDATYDVTTTVTDAAGNASTDTSSSELTVDTTAPVTPTVNVLTTNNSTPTLTGTTSTIPGESLSVVVNGVTYEEGDGNLVVNPDGSWQLTIPAGNAMVDGDYDVVATTTDLAGNSSTDVTATELTIDSVSPATPTVNAQTTSDTTPLVSGSATVGVGETLSVTVDGTPYTAGDGHLVDNGDGTWDLMVPTALADNTYPVTVEVYDTAGNSSLDTTTAELVIDTTPPVTPTVTAQSTSDTTPILTGTADLDVGDILTVSIDGITYVAGDGNLVHNGDGTWQLNIPSALSEITFEVVVTVTDLAGNATSDSSSDELIIDLTPPNIPEVVALITNDTTPTLSGNAVVAANETLTVSVDGVLYTEGDGNLSDNGDGTWSLSVPNPLAEGTYDVTATVTDAAGNSSIDTTNDELVVDITAPIIPTVVAQTTNTATPTVSGSATVAPGETLTVTVDGVFYTAGDGNLVDNGDGSWDLSISVPLVEGSYDVVVTVTDEAGNEASDITTSELIVDLTAPIAPGVTSLTTNDTTPIVEGTATVGTGETLSVEVNGATYVAGDGQLVDNGDGTWTLSIPALDVLAEGLYQVVATVMDAAGNSSIDPGVDDLLVDTTAPNAPGVTSLTTNVTTPTLVGTASLAVGESLSVTVNAVTYLEGDGNLVVNGDGTWSLTVPVPLMEGIYDVTAIITDGAGNLTNDPSSSELLIDVTAPVTPTATPLTTNNTTPLISGTANAGPGEVLTVVVNAVTYTAGDGNLVDNGDGTWALMIPTPLAEGSYDVQAIVTDAASNVSADTGVDELEIDLTAPVVPTVNALITNDASPTLSGNATLLPGEILTVSVDGITYSAGDGHLTLNGDGTWTLNVPTTLADSTYSVTATVTDAAGNTSVDTTSTELVVDTAPPPTPTVVALTTNNTTPAIQGSATLGAGETLSVTVDGVTYTPGDGNLTDNGDGTWSLVPSAALPENTYEVTATITDAAGNSTPDSSVTELVIDVTQPVIPTVSSLVTNDTTPTLSGTATVGAGETLSVSVGGTIYTAGDGNLVDNGDGTWVLAIPNALPESVFDVIATVTDSAGNVSTDVSSNELVVDTTSPTVPTVTALTTNDTTPTLAGNATLNPGETLTIAVDSVLYTAGDGDLFDNGDGTWTLNLPTALADATYEVVAAVTDAAGNVSSDISASELVIDTTAPTVPTVTALTTNDTTPTVSGTATVGAGEVLTVSIDGTTYTAGDGNLVDNGDGTWTLMIPVPLSEGVFGVIASVTDSAGNVSSDVSATELIIDVTAPIAPGVTSLATADTTPVIEGTASVGAGEILTVDVNAVTYTAGDGHLVDNGDGTWSLTIPATNALPENLYQVVATVTDEAGNSTIDPSIDDLLVDTTAPSTPGVTSLTTNNTMPTIGGTATVLPGETLTVTVDGITYSAGDGNLTDNGDGTWSLTVSTALSEGLYDVTATVTDSAGNITADPSSAELLIDTTAPTIPIASPLVTNDTTPVVTGTANVGPGETLIVTVDGTTYSVGDGYLVDNGDGTWSLSIPTALTDGVYDVVVSVTDAAGNISTDTGTTELTIDTSTPAIPSVNAQTTNEASPTISGNANVAASETLTVSVDGVLYTAGDGNLFDNGDGTWTLNLPTALADATYEVVATVTDAAGNVSSDISTNELVIDTTAPTVPTVTALTTNDTTPTVSGTATLGAGEVLTVSIDGTTYTAGDGNLVDNGDGTWTLMIPVPLSEGTFDVIASVTDSAGNVSSDVSASELNIDVTAPIAPGVTSLATADTTPVIEGTASVGAGEILTVEVNAVTYTAGNGHLVNNGDGTWSLTIPVSNALPEHLYQVVATVTDEAGNSTIDPSIDDLLVDTTAPSTPGVTSLTTNNTMPTIGGTATVLPGETLTVTVDGITYSAGDGNLTNNGDGTWSLSIPTALSDGVYDVVVSVTDAAGNISTDTGTTELTVDTSTPAIPSVNAQTTNEASPTISGNATVAASETLTVSVDSVTYTSGEGNLVDNGDGTWTLNLPTALADATYEVVATVTDAAGNVSSDISTSELVIDTTAPVAPGVTNLVTADTTPIIYGTANVGVDEVLSVEVNGITYTEGDGHLLIAANGTWQLQIPNSDGLTEGEYQVIAIVTDAAGNSATDPGIDDLVIDVTAPATPGVTSLTTKVTTPTLQGTAIVSIGEVLTVEVNGVMYTAGDGHLVDNLNGSWALTLPTDLEEGSYDVTASITDSAGNQATDPGSSELMIDLTVPNTPAVNSLTTNTGTPVITGVADVNSDDVLSVVVDGITYTAGDGQLVDHGDGTWTLTILDDLVEGIYDVTVVVTDLAGNQSVDVTTSDLHIDLTTPVIPSVETLITNDSSPFINGAVALNSGEVFTVELNGTIYTEGDGNLVIDGNGNWNLSIPEALPDGVYDVLATVIDSAGNVSTDVTSSELTIDTVAPVAPTVDTLTTVNTAPTLTGSANVAEGETLSVTFNGETFQAGDGYLFVTPDGVWQLNIPSELPVGNYPITATITDVAGNTSTNETGQLIIVEPIPENDFDGDGVPDGVDLDSDNDGIPDLTEGERDSDGDGAPDYLDLDSDNDGIADIVEVNGDDFDNDYRVDNFLDRDNNGLSDDLQVLPFALVDTDNDAIVDYRDLDSDNDGLSDLLESGGVDTDNDGRIDNFVDDNNNGADDNQELTPASGRDTDSDSIPNRLDLDTDNDGLFDLVESGGVDNLQDGVLDSMQDINNNGIPDSVDADITQGADFDDDGIDDRFDITFVGIRDTDDDGIIDSADPDANGDGYADDGANPLALGEALPDTNGNGSIDVLEPLDDGIVFTGLAGNGCSIDGGTSKDPLFFLLLAFSGITIIRRNRYALRRNIVKPANDIKEAA